MKKQTATAQHLRKTASGKARSPRAERSERDVHSEPAERPEPAPRSEPAEPAKPTERNAQGLIIGAILVAAAVAAVLIGRPDDDRPAARPDTVASPTPGAPVVHDPHGDDPYGGPLPPGHPPIDGAPSDPHGADGLPPGHPPLEGAAPHPGDGAGSVKVEKLDGGLSVAEIFAQAETLEGKTVKLRAKVVKSMPNILGRTWLHVQDGTGDAARGDHDLVVTTAVEPTIGQTVVLEGVLVRNKDLGSGYRYDVLLEDAKVEGLDTQQGNEG